MWDDCLIEREKDIVGVILSNILNQFIVTSMIFFFWIFFNLKSYKRSYDWKTLEALGNPVQENFYILY